MRRSPCPIAAALDLFGDKWTLLVLRDLFCGRKRYGEFAASLEKIPTNILAERLTRLEEAGLIASTPYQTNPPRYDYALTAAGRSLRPVLQELVNWGRRHFADTRVRAEFTGNPDDSPCLPDFVKLPKRPARA
ncbi:MAG TPA: helix-turn-helix domain-containing protein [Opitutus sp.]|nr:helix-turn-helix domain-containing protein [Opitutus sp.]